MTKFVGLLLSKIIQPWQIRDQFAMRIQLAVLISVCRSSGCGPTDPDAIVFHVQSCVARTRNLLHFTKAKVSHTTMSAEPSNSNLGAVPVCVCVQLCTKEFHTILFKTQRCRTDANSCGHHWFFVCTVYSFGCIFDDLVDFSNLSRTIACI